MKYFITLILSLAAFFCFLNIPSENMLPEDINTKDYPYFDWMLERSFPDQSINFTSYIKSKEAISKQIRSSSKSVSRFDEAWEVQGPGNIGARINTVAVNPSNNLEIYAGFSEGGVFKTIDGGLNWEPIFDESPFLSIGHIAIDPSDTNTVYVGTGDPNVSGLPFIGNGLYKSEDGGMSWSWLGLEEQRIISKVEIHPINSDILFVASMGLPFSYNNTRGIFKSMDGGMSWDQVLFVSDSTGFSNVIINPADPNLVYASSWDRVRSNSVNLVYGDGSDIYRSIDGGENWERIVNGLPDEPLCRTGIAVCKNFPNNVYAVIVGTDFELQGIYRSRDFGFNFEEVNIDKLPNSVLGGFGWYFGKVAVNPDDPDHIYILGVGMYETRDNGENWNQATPNWWTYEVHADKHDLQFQDGQMYLATDGGLYQKHINSSQWDDIENIATTQFYRTAYNPNSPQLYYGGAQDNGSVGGNNISINEWDRIFGGDGFQLVFDPSDKDHYFVETQRGEIRVTIDGGQSFSSATQGLEGPRDWDMQYILSPHNNNILYTGTNKVYMTTDSYNVKWEAISDVLTGTELVGGRDANITTLSESPITQGVIYAGTNDGRVWGTKDGGSEWDFLSENLPLRYVTDVKASPSMKSWAYVCFSGYKDNDNIPRIHRTKDYGKSWEDISADLPDIALNDVFVLPNSDDDILFVASDAGVYGSINAGKSWNRLGNNMPNITIYDLEHNIENNELIAATFGRSIMTYPLDEIKDCVKIYEYQQISICELDSVFLEGSYQNQAGIYIDTFLNFEYCDSIIETELTIFNERIFSQIDSICEGDNLIIGGQLVTEPGIYRDTISDEIGCDSIISSQISILPSYQLYPEYQLCDGDSIIIDGQTIFESGIVVENLKTSFGCDSIISSQISILPSYNLHPEYQLCDGDSIIIDGQTIFESGIVVENLKTSFGCDSIISSQISIHPSYNLHPEYQLCDGDSIIIDGQTIFESGIVVENLKTSFGCDSIISHYIEFSPEYFSSFNFEICEGDTLFISGNELYLDGIFVDNLSSQYGCDSIVSYNIVYKGFEEDTRLLNFCKGDTILLANQTITETGIYFDTITTSSCDTLVRYDLLFEEVFAEIIQDSTILLSTAAPNYLHQWYICSENSNSLIEGAIDSFYFISESNNYGLLVTNPESMCSYFTDCIEVIISSAADNYYKPNVSVFPNPSNGTFNIKSDNAIENLSIYSLDGALNHFISRSVMDNLLIQIPSTSPGLYILKFTQNAKTYSIKLVVY